MSSIFVNEDISADVLDITWNGCYASATSPSIANYLRYQDVDHVPNVAASGLSGDFVQWNDVVDGEINRSILPSHGFELVELVQTIESMRIVESGDVIDPNTFVGGVGLLGGTQFDGIGEAFVAVRPTSAPSNLYWFRLEFGDPGDPIVYSQGQYGSDGESLVVSGFKDCEGALGDFNRDRIVDLLDLASFVNSILRSNSICQSDMNQVGEMNLLDIDLSVDVSLGEWCATGALRSPKSHIACEKKSLGKYDEMYSDFNNDRIGVCIFDLFTSSVGFLFFV
ncbi:MAG: hypothetical protein AAGA30_10335 [Planctomycetota bacterium]